MLVGYWMLSNRQIFENKVIPINSTFEPKRYGHHMIDCLFKVSPGTPFLVLFAIELFLFIIPWDNILYDYITRSKIIHKLGHFTNNTEFFTNLIPRDREYLLIKEEFMIDHQLNRIDRKRLQEI